MHGFKSKLCIKIVKPITVHLQQTTNGFWQLFNIFAVFKSGQDTPLEGILPFDRFLMPTLVEVTVVFFIFITPFVAFHMYSQLDWTPMKKIHANGKSMQVVIPL